jgi:hypothetical protein
MERAADNLDKLEARVQKSVGREKKVKERRKGWEDVNNEKKKKGLKGNAFELLEEEENKRQEREWVSDDEMPEVDDESGVEEGDVASKEVRGEVKHVDAVVPESVPLPAATVEEDEML